MEAHRGEFTISTAPPLQDLEAICGFLAQAYWANTRSRETIARSLQHSLVFGLFHGAKQIGLARVVTDYATFAWLCDVFIEEAYRGQGLGKWLMETVVSHPELQGLRRWILATRDAHGLYEKYGFVELKNPKRWMEKIGLG